MTPTIDYETLTRSNTLLGFTRFDREILPVDPRPLACSLELQDVLGCGSFGVVRICKDKLTGELLACKSIDKTLLRSTKEFKDVRREVRVMRRVAHLKNVVSLRKVFEDRTNVHIVMDLCSGGSLATVIKNHIRQHQKLLIPEICCASVCKVVARVLKECHELGIMHRDIKLDNILLCNVSDWSSITVADFGLATPFYPGNKFIDLAGTRSYMAPEMLDPLSLGYSQEADVWSLGIVLYVLLCGRFPYKVSWDANKKRWLRKGSLKVDMSKYPWTVISKDAHDLIHRMLCKDVNRRITPKELLHHPWIVRHTNPMRRSATANARAMECKLAWHHRIIQMLLPRKPEF